MNCTLDAEFVISIVITLVIMIALSVMLIFPENSQDDGPTEYKTRTVVEDMSPEAMRDFFWDDEFRRHWDEMLSYTKTWEACEETGFMIVQWVRKVRVFCMLRSRFCCNILGINLSSSF